MRNRRIPVCSITAGLVEVTPLGKPLSGFHGIRISPVSEDKVMRIAHKCSPVWASNK